MIYSLMIQQASSYNKHLYAIYEAKYFLAELETRKLMKFLSPKK